MRPFRTILYLLCLLGIALASKTDPLLFEKKSGLDTFFPPNIPRSSPDDFIPTGHLRSLGYQRHPSAMLDYHKQQPTSKELQQLIVEGTPFYFTETGQGEAPIFAMTDEELDQKFGQETILYVPIPRYRTEEIVEQDTLSSFLSSYRKRDEYLASTMPEKMRSLFPVPLSLQCGPYTSRLLEAELWMAYGGTGSFMHYHGDHQLHCMIDGRKDFIFVHPAHKDKFRCRETRPNSGEGISTIDMDMINMFKDAQIADAPWTFATIQRGQCVFIPAGYLHHVRSYGRALAYKIHFAVLEDKANDTTVTDPSTACGKMVPKASRTLEDFNFVWTMKKGVEQLSNEQLTPDDLIAILRLIARGKDTLSKEEFIAFYDRVMAKSKLRSDTFPTGERVFNFLDKKRTQKLTISKLSLIESRLKQLVKVMNKIHIPEHTEL